MLPPVSVRALLSFHLENNQKIFVLVHPKEIHDQNAATFRAMYPGISTGQFQADRRGWEGQVTFAMVPTLSRPENLITMPAHALVVVDEAHHAAAETCSNIVRAAQTLNPDVRLLGVTATPVRGDKKPLAEWYSNVCDEITAMELTTEGSWSRCRRSRSICLGRARRTSSAAVWKSAC